MRMTYTVERGIVESGSTDEEHDGGLVTPRYMEHGAGGQAHSMNDEVLQATRLILMVRGGRVRF